MHRESLALNTAFHSETKMTLSLFLVLKLSENKPVDWCQSSYAVTEFILGQTVALTEEMVLWLSPYQLDE